MNSRIGKNKKIVLMNADCDMVGRQNKFYVQVRKPFNEIRKSQFDLSYLSLKSKYFDYCMAKTK